MAGKTRAGALALAGLTAVFAAPLAAPEPTGQAELAHAATAAEFAQLRPLAGVRDTRVRQGPRRAARGALGKQVDRLEGAALRAESARPRFPVDGQFNWGQGGAAFGASRSGHSHEGQDVFARTGTPLVAVRDGVVLQTGNDGGRGNYVGVFSPVANRTYVYLHMVSPARVAPGEHVTAGQRLGGVGCTGSCFGEHLHFEVRRGRGLERPAENPRPALTRWSSRDGVRAILPPGSH